MREFKKGSLGLLVLHLLYERPSYGYELCERLRERSQGTLSFQDGAVYPLLHAFERDGIAEGYWEGTNVDEDGEAQAEALAGGPARRGPRRRYYRLTPAGVAALRQALREWQAFSGAVGRVLGGQAALGGEA